MITIHNFARGARGLRVVWLCEEMGLPYQLEVVPYPPSAAYLAKHPLGSVPFLEDDNGVAMSESVAMTLYLATKYGPTPLLPGKDDPRFARVLEMVVFSEASIGAGLNSLLAAHFMAPEAEKRNWSATAGEQRIEKALTFVEQVLGSNAYLAGADVTLADLCMTTSLGMWRGALGKTLSEPLVAYRERLAARPAYQRAAETQKR